MLWDRTFELIPWYNIGHRDLSKEVPHSLMNNLEDIDGQVLGSLQVLYFHFKEYVTAKWSICFLRRGNINSTPCIMIEMKQIRLWESQLFTTTFNEFYNFIERTSSCFDSSRSTSLNRFCYRQFLLYIMLQSTMESFNRFNYTWHH
jgi:hypothetical protein